jgi:hypothetical protein
VFGSELVEKRLLECQVRQDLDQGSDHYLIATRIALEPQYCPEQKRRNWKKLDADAVRARAQGLRRLPAREQSEEGIKSYTSYLISFVQEAINATVPWVRPSGRATPWWTEEINNLVQEERRLRNVWTKTGKATAHSQRLEVGAAKKRLIAWEKRKAYRADVHAAAESPERIWRLARWARTKESLPLELLTMLALNTPRGKAETVPEKTQALFTQFYPKAVADLSDITDTTFVDHTLNNLLTSNTKATLEEVQQAIR